MDISEWFFFVSICFLGAFSPGPSFLIIVHNTLTYGRNAGYISSFGHSCGIFLYALVACFFLEFLINFNSNFYYFLRILAVFYLIYLSINLIRSNFSNNRNEPLINKNFFLNGFYISFLNPKIGIFFISLFSQFIYLDNDFYFFLILSFVASFVDFFVYVMYVKLILKFNIKHFFNKNELVISLLFGFVLMVFSIIILFEILNEF